MTNYTTHVAMDTHKKQHKVALYYPGDNTDKARRQNKNRSQGCKEITCNVQGRAAHRGICPRPVFYTLQGSKFPRVKS